MSTPARCRIALTLIVLSLSAAVAAAEDAYYSIPLTELTITTGELPKLNDPRNESPFRWDLLPLDVWVDGPGEAYVDNGRVVARSAPGQDVTGRLSVPEFDAPRAHLIKFLIPSAKADATAQEAFLTIKREHYRDLQRRDQPGSAWFRHQAREAGQQLAKLKNEIVQPEGNFDWRFGDPTFAFSMFSGGRAISENLQLDRLLRAPRHADQEPTVDLASLPGIDVAAIDWKPLIKDANPKLDPLSKRIPADQHAVFFPSFDAVVQLTDELGGAGNPDLMRLAEPRSENADTKNRYERQLGLSMSALSRLLGPTMIRSVALTGSDPYFRVGTDVAVLFETSNPAVFSALLLSKIQLGVANDPEVKPQSGAVAGVNYTGFRSSDRRVCSYVAQLRGAVVITNSLAQLERLTKVGPDAPALDLLDEYKFFRTRYPLGENNETAFVFLSDATIRRWCSARWRIANARRTFAAAGLAELTTQHAPALAAKQPAHSPLPSSPIVADGGHLSLTPGGVSSTAWGTLNWMTPIVELPLDKVTKEEADLYRQWRDGYQRNWRWAFDPIGARIALRPERWAVDLTVMPLIAGTEFRELISVSRGSEIKLDAGDQHRALVHFAMSINTNSLPVRDAGNFVSTMLPAVRTNPFSWLGSSVSLYLDDDAVWQEWREQRGDQRREFEHRVLGRLPLALNAEVSDPLKLALFLTSLRAFAEQTAPGMMTWESLTYREQPYVKVSPTERARGMLPTESITIYYAPSADGLIVTLNEAVLKRALDRIVEREEAKKNPAAAKDTGSKDAASNSFGPWLGKNFCVQVDRKMFDILAATRALAFDSVQTMQRRSWSNLPILNEWKRLFPDRNPVEVHEQLWGARLVCPGGGEYAWNDEWKTMESTIYGHAGQPKDGPDVPPALARFANGNFGLTFDGDGLRGRVELTRTPKP